MTTKAAKKAGDKVLAWDGKINRVATLENRLENGGWLALLENGTSIGPVDHTNITDGRSKK